MLHGTKMDVVCNIAEWGLLIKLRISSVVEQKSRGFDSFIRNYVRNCVLIRGETVRHPALEWQRKWRFNSVRLNGSVSYRFESYRINLLAKVRKLVLTIHLEGHVY